MSQQPAIYNSAETGVVVVPPVNTDIASRKRARYSVSANMKLLPNPDVVLRKAGKTIEAYRDLLKDAHVASCAQSRKAGVFALEWEINPNNSPTEIVDFVTRQFQELDVPRVLGELLDASLYGYAISEIMWGMGRDGFVVATDIVGKPQEWFKFDEKGAPFFTAANYADGEPLPDKKFLVVQHQPTYLNPYGEAVLSRCYWPITFKKQLMSHMMTFAEKYGMPYLIGYYDAIMGGQKAATELVTALDGLYADGVAAIPSPSRAEILDSAKQAAIDVFMSGIVFYNAEVSKAILSQTLTTEQGATGSYAMSQTHLMVRKDVVDSDRRSVERVLNGFIRWLCDINWTGNETYPTFRLFEQTDVDQALADRDAKLFAMGVRFGADYFAEGYGIDPRHITIVDPSAAPPPAGAFAAPRRRIIDTDGQDITAKPIPAQVEGTRMLSEAVGEVFGPHEMAYEALDEMLRPIINKIQMGRSYEEVNEALAELLPEMNSESFERLLAHSMFMADLAGRVSTR